MKREMESAAKARTEQERLARINLEEENRKIGPDKRAEINPDIKIREDIPSIRVYGEMLR